jgi:hypothetical protein
MSDTTAGLRRKIAGAGDLQSVVHTMKAVAASSIGQYEKSASALADYNHAMELGLGARYRESGPAPLIPERKTAGSVGAVVSGSDQGLVGQFNDVVADFAVQTLAALPGKPEVRAVGERLVDAGWPPGILPEVMGGGTATLRVFIREYLALVVISDRCKMERLDRRIGQRRDATRAPTQARSGWRPSGRLLVSPLHHLRTGQILSNRWGPPQTSRKRNSACWN